MKKILASVLMLSIVSQAQFAIPVTPFKNVNIVCKSKGATIAISEKDKTFWQTEGDEQQGIQYKASSWIGKGCTHCFDATGSTVIAGQVLTAQIETSFDQLRNKLSLTLSLIDNTGKKQVMLKPSDSVCSAQ